VNEVIRKNAERFGVEGFREEFRKFVEGKVGCAYILMKW